MIIQILNFFEHYSSAIQAISTLFLVMVTVYYAIQTRNTVVAMKKSDELRNRPSVSLFIKQREEWVNFVDLIIINTGNNLAKKISFNLSNDLLLINNNYLSQTSIFKNGISILPSNETIRMPLISLIGRIEELDNFETEITINYYDSNNKKYEEEILINFKGLIDHSIDEPPLYKIANNLEKISRCIERIDRNIEKKQIIYSNKN